MDDILVWMDGVFLYTLLTFQLCWWPMLTDTLSQQNNILLVANKCLQYTVGSRMDVYAKIALSLFFFAVAIKTLSSFVYTKFPLNVV